MSDTQDGTSGGSESPEPESPRAPVRFVDG